MKKLLIIPALAVIALAGCGAASSTVPPGHEPKPTQDADAGTTSKVVWTNNSTKMYEVMIPTGKDISMRCYVTVSSTNAVTQTCSEVTMR